MQKFQFTGGGCDHGPRYPGGHALREAVEARVRREAAESIEAMQSRENFAFQVGPQFYQARGLPVPACLLPQHYILGGDEHLDLAGLADGCAARAASMANAIRSEEGFEANADPRVMLFSLQRLAGELHGLWPLLNPPGYSPLSGTFFKDRAPLTDSSPSGIQAGTLHPGPVLGPGSHPHHAPPSERAREADAATRMIDRRPTAQEGAIDYELGNRIAEVLDDIGVFALKIAEAAKANRIMPSSFAKVHLTTRMVFDRLGSLGTLV
jgi:hypothetical protein